MNKNRIIFVLVALGLLALGYVLLTRDSKPKEPEVSEVTEAPVRSAEALPKVLVLGMDGLDWKYLDEYMGEGLLPNFSRAVDGGTRGNLMTMMPPLSPILWTTIATGKTPDQHGVLDFFVPGPDGELEPVPSTRRKVPAIWDMLDQHGDSCGVVAWYATWPPDLLEHGFIVTDRVSYHHVAAMLKNQEDPHQEIEKRVYPPEIAPLIVDHLYDPDLALNELVSQFFLPTQDDLEKAARGEEVFFPKTYSEDFSKLYVTAHTVAESGLKFMQEKDPDALFVYFEWIDATKHLFADYLPPRQDWVDPTSYERYHEVIRRAYMFQDFILGQYLDAMDENTVLLVVSDHGWKFKDNRLPFSAHLGQGYAAQWHDPAGVYLAYGKGITPGAKSDAAGILDVTPTILALRGLPQGEDMPGRPLPLPGAYPDDLPERISSYDDTWTRNQGERVDLGEDGDYYDKLIALGYVDPGQKEQFSGLDSVYTPKELVNLAGYHRSINEHDKAKDALLQARALQKAPNFEVDISLANIHARSNEWTQVMEIMRPYMALERAKVDAVLLTLEALKQTGDLEGAETYFEKRKEQGYFDKDPTDMGRALGILGRGGESRDSLRQLLTESESKEEFNNAFALFIISQNIPQKDIDWVVRLAHDRFPDLPLARLEWAKLLFREGDSKGAFTELGSLSGQRDPMAAEAEKLSGLMRVELGQIADSLPHFQRYADMVPDDPEGHLNLGSALRFQKRYQEAEEAYEAARKLAPRHPGLLAVYGKLMLETDRPEEGKRLIRESLDADPKQPALRALLEDLER